jgi:hypothetical protein
MSFTAKIGNLIAGKRPYSKLRWARKPSKLSDGTTWFGTVKTKDALKYWWEYPKKSGWRSPEEFREFRKKIKKDGVIFKPIKLGQVSNYRTLPPKPMITVAGSGGHHRMSAAFLSGIKTINVDFLYAGRGEPHTVWKRSARLGQADVVKVARQTRPNKYPTRKGLRRKIL